jgi:hypothetical protein
MGWLGTKQTRAQAIREITRSHETATCILFTEVPAGVWSVWELTKSGPDCGKRIIVLDLIEARDGYQMVKTMDETTGPYYFDCPPAYLEAAKDFASEGYSAGWRESVRKRGLPLRGTFVHADGVSHD